VRNFVAAGSHSGTLARARCGATILPSSRPRSEGPHEHRRDVRRDRRRRSCLLSGIVAFFGTRLLHHPAGLGVLLRLAVGAQGVQALFGDGFLSTAFSRSSLLPRLLFALLSYLFWFVAVCRSAVIWGTASWWILRIDVWTSGR
jgi:hypothetical protein